MSRSKRGWQERWSVLFSGPSGGQGRTSTVRRKDDSSDKEEFFLKELANQKTPERRERMYQEVAAYETLCPHDGIPLFVESNAWEYRDHTAHLYLVTERIPGFNMEDAAAARLATPFPFDQALRCVVRLLEIVKYCHSKEVVHRDIKPGNIMLRHGLSDDPVLVDFGLSFESSMDSDFADNRKETSLDIELGNRFLRMPEQGAFSLNKRDPRSDLTFVVGILFYLLTLESPARTGTDDRGRFAHQRPKVHALLAATLELEVLNRVLRLFDKAFANPIEMRFQSSDELLDALRNLNGSVQTNGEALIAATKKRMTERDELARKERYELLHKCRQATYQVLSALASEIGLVSYGLPGEINERRGKVGVAIIRSGAVPLQAEQVFIIVTPVGAQFVFQMEDCSGRVEEAGRVDIDDQAPKLNEPIIRAIRAYAIEHVRLA